MSTAAFVELLRSSCLLIPSEYYIYQMCERWLLAQEKNAVDILRKRLYTKYGIVHMIWTILYGPYSMNYLLGFIKYSPYPMNHNRGKSLIDNVLEQIRFYQMNGSQVRDTFS